MSEIKIVEYTPSLAKGISEMWNNSGEGWNGDNDNTTEQSTIENEAQSSHLNLYIALDGDKVVGYCKLSKYAYDENTLYIDLLNVLPTYHGKKVGKLLVLKSVERTIELNYPRLDLFTWAGNTKAVPLYKKTGFFWEKMESNSTHLMNYIPTVLSTELIKHYFDKIDWYNDSKREIEIEPDGQKENGFDFYHYSWEKNGKYLNVGFEKTGRGIAKIDCDDFSIETIVNEAKLVFGQKHQITYKVNNKTQKPLLLEIKGKDNKNIQFDFNISKEIIGCESITADFYLDQIEKTQTQWTTHPVVLSEISIDHKKALFKTGINPQFPLVFKTFNGEMFHKDHESKIIFNVENNFDEDCEFTVELPESDTIKFAQKTLSFQLKAKEKSNVTAKALLSNSSIIKTKIPINVRFIESNNDLKYEQAFILNLGTYNGNNYGETQTTYFMSLDKLYFWIDNSIECNEIHFKNLISYSWGSIGIPKVGKPFSSEFNNKKAEKIAFNRTFDYCEMIAYYLSDDFKGCEFACHYRLFPSGMLEYFIEMIKFPTDQTEVQICYSTSFDHRHLQFSYAGKIIHTDDSLYNDSDFNHWDGNKIDENWLYNEQGQSTFALIWDKELKPINCSWYFAFEHQFSQESSRQSKSIYIALDYFNSVKKVREFALRKEVEDKQAFQSLDLLVNEGNPFVTENCNISYIDLKDDALECTVDLKSGNHSFETLSSSVSKEEDKHQLDFQIKLNKNQSLQFIEAEAKYLTKDFTFKKACFMKEKGDILCKVSEREQHQIFEVNNGIFTIQSSPEFAPSVFSLMYQDHEWLNSDFPVKGPKAWWNPWFGGLCHMPSSIKSLFYLEEKTSVQFTKKKDNFGNEWEGIEITTCFDKYEPLKGMSIKQYYLMMPYLPILLTYAIITQEKGNAQYISPYCEIFPKSDDDIKNTFFDYEYKGETIITKCGVEDIGFSSDSSLSRFYGNNRKEKLYFYNNEVHSSMGIGSNLSVTNCSYNTNKTTILKNDKTVIIAPKFLIITEQEIKVSELIDLKNITQFN